MIPMRSGGSSDPSDSRSRWRRDCQGLRLAAILAVLCLAATPLLSDAAAGNRIQPLRDAGVAKIKVGRKTSTYHRATAAEPIEFRVTGPTPVRILSRYLYAKGQASAPVSYRLEVSIDGVALPSPPERAKPSKSTWKGRPVGTLEREIVRIPAGSHRVLVRPVNPKATVAVRIFLGGGERARVNWIDFAPETLSLIHISEPTRQR
ncbi:MAG: hypothetical protein QUU85_16700, partial [Candidatus Eisenbacteria bacterium]|nr:hypothetical protein [Candidatus Eisenbacteria bacterium]